MRDIRTEGGAPYTAAVFLMFATLFVLSATFDRSPSVDPTTNALSAYAWANSGSPYVPELQSLVENPNSAGRVTWFVDSPRGPVSQYPPGAALLAVPLYLISDGGLEYEELREELHLVRGERPVPPLWPAAATAALATSAALALLFSALVITGIPAQSAMLSVVVLGLGTSIWTVAADSLWQHGPALLAIALAMRAAVRSNLWLIAASCLIAVLIRPHVVLITAAVGIGVAFQRRRGSSAAAVALGTLAGVLALGAYNSWVFGRFSLSSGYESFLTDNLAAPDLPALAGTMFDVLLSADRGVVTWSPFIGLALLAVPFVWRESDAWIKITAMGSFAYLIFQYVAVQGTAFRYSGGQGFSYYRYPLEAIFGLAPLGVLAAKRFLNTSKAFRLVFAAAAIYAILVHAIAAFDLK